MTTATTPVEGKVDLAKANGTKRRGRPPGSKNRPKPEATIPAKRTAAAAPAQAATPTRTATPKVHAVLVSNDGIEVLHVDGTSETFAVSLTNAPLFDRRK